ncbi:metallophosphoesterase [Ihubacter sp. rT4E-8]|uniref:metallophosphoesterase n=1 Tax=Ihubacter sp. rT4E-8 TaxID=3242369 RepID=UPI003CE8F42C
MSKRRERKRHGCRNFLFFCLLCAGVWFYGTFTLTTTDVTVRSDQISSPVTIVQLSDLHGYSFGEDNKYLIERIKEANPDFIVATGDMFTAGDADGQDVAVELLGRLAKMYPVYSVNGEHDNDDRYEKRLTEAGVDVLEYEWRNITVGSTVLRLYGITNVYYSPTFDLTNEFDLDRGYFNILAAHIANFQPFAEFGMDLSLCGDTHGGQVRLPVAGCVYNGSEWFPEIQGEGDVIYQKGLYEKNGAKLFVSSGLGSYPIPLRFWNRPEVAVIHLEAE